MAAERSAISYGKSWPLPDSRLRWYAYARVAWYHLLKSLGAGAGDNVLLPDLICDVMVEPLDVLGVEARYYRSAPLEPIDAEQLARHCDRRTRAVLAVHYFGLPQPIDAALAFCRYEGIPLVEDVSQGFMGATDDGTPLGAVGDVALFSFRKSIDLPHGAGLIAHDPQIAAAVERTPISLATPRRDVWRYWGKRLDRRCFGGKLERGLDSIRRRDYGSRCHVDAVNPDPFERCLVQASRSAQRLIQSFDLQHERHRRQARFTALAVRWQHEPLPGKPLLNCLPPGCIPYAFPIQPTDGDSPEALAAQLLTLGLPSDPWPRLPQNVPPSTHDRRYVLVWLT